MQHTKEVVEECQKLTHFLNNKAESFDKLMSEQRIQLTSINEKLVYELTNTKNEVDEKYTELKSDLKKTDKFVALNGIKVREFADIIDRIEIFQRE